MPCIQCQISSGMIHDITCRCKNCMPIGSSASTGCGNPAASNRGSLWRKDILAHRGKSRESFALLFKKQLGYFLLFPFIFCSSFCFSCRMLAWAAPPEDSLSESFLAVMLHIHVTSCKVPGCIQSQHEMYAMEDIYINISICQWVSNQWYQLLPSEFWIVSVPPKAGFLPQTIIKFKWRDFVPLAAPFLCLSSSSSFRLAWGNCASVESQSFLEIIRFFCETGCKYVYQNCD